jgi:hypothetical protein
MLNLKLPSLSIPRLQLGSLSAVFAAVANIKAVFGVNLLGPGGLPALQAALGSLNIKALIGVPLPALPSASVSASASASAAVSAEWDAALEPLSMSMLENLSATASLVAQLSGLGIPLSLTPCPICGKT